MRSTLHYNLNYVTTRKLDCGKFSVTSLLIKEAAIQITILGKASLFDQFNFSWFTHIENFYESGLCDTIFIAQTGYKSFLNHMKAIFC